MKERKLKEVYCPWVSIDVSFNLERLKRDAKVPTVLWFSSILKSKGTKVIGSNETFGYGTES